MGLLGDEPKERIVRGALAALVLAPFLVFVPRVLFGDAPDEPLPPTPSWTHLIVVSASRWDAPLRAVERPAVAELDRRASRIDRMHAPSPSSAACAASLWTGRWPGNHGVLENDRALAAGTWTVAEGARASGAATAAFLQEPFVSGTGVAGFDEVRESPDLFPGEMARSGAAFLADHADERVVLWLHLYDAGAGGAAVAEVLDGLFAALEPGGRRFESAVLLCAFGSDAGAVDPVAPLWLALPGALSTGRRSGGRASLTDVAGTLRELLRLPPPTDAPLQSRADTFANAVRGGSPQPWILVQSGEGDAWIEGDRRLFRATGGSFVAEELLSDGTRRPLDAAARDVLVASLASQAKGLAAGRTPSREAQVPEAWWGLWGW